MCVYMCVRACVRACVCVRVCVPCFCHALATVLLPCSCHVPARFMLCFLFIWLFQIVFQALAAPQGTSFFCALIFLWNAEVYQLQRRIGVRQLFPTIGRTVHNQWRTSFHVVLNQRQLAAAQRTQPVTLVHTCNMHVVAGSAQYHKIPGKCSKKERVQDGVCSAGYP